MANRRLRYQSSMQHSQAASPPCLRPCFEDGSISARTCANFADAMPRPPSFAQVEIETGERSAPVQRSEPDAPFHIAILGDFTGRENRAQIDPTFVARQP